MTTGDAAGPQGADISARPIWILCAVLLAALLAVALYAPGIMEGPLTAQGRAHELGLLESVGNVILLLGIIAAAMTLPRARDGLLRGWIIVILLGIIFVLGEESSWGQHYFNWETSGWFAKFNDQGETNLHNTEGGWLDQKPRALLLLGMILGTIVHPLVKHFRNGRGLFDKPWWLAPTLVCLAPVVFSQIGALPERIDDITHGLGLNVPSVQTLTNNYRSSEMEEVFMYLFFITYLLSLRARLGPRRAG